MKNKFLYAISAVVLLLTSCEFEHPYPTVLPDPVFPENGVQAVETNLAYESYVETITIQRTYGVSKELALNIVVDGAMIEEQNTINGTTYTLLDPKYYEIPEVVTFQPNTKSTTLEVVFKPYAMAKEMGLEAANNAILPIRIEADGIEDKAYLSELMLQPAIATPQITVQLPEAPTQLSFVGVSKLTQTLDLVADVNFNNVDVTKLEWKVLADKVAAYNSANGTNYKLLPSDYKIGAPVFDKDALTVTTPVDFDCYKISNKESYVLPLQLVENHDDYIVNQSDIYYVVVNITELKVWIDNGGATIDSSTGKGVVTVKSNAPLNFDLPIVVKHIPGMLAGYNSANSTSYLGVDTSTVEIAEAKIPAYSMSVDVPFTVDISTMEFDGPNAYLVPLMIDKNELMEGTLVGDDSTLSQYIKIKKSLVGTYQIEAIASGHTIDSIKADEHYSSGSSPEIKEKAGEGFGNTIKLVGTGNAGWPKGGEEYKNKWKYAVSYSASWADGLIYFNILMDQPVPGKPNCVKLGDFCDRPNGNQGGYDPIVDFDGGSYVNTVTGEVFFDMVVYGAWSVSVYSVRMYDPM